MGSIVGKAKESDPPRYHVLRYVPYEVRLYEPCFVAETTAENLAVAFGALAKYIGAHGTAGNSKGKRCMNGGAYPKLNSRFLLVSALFHRRKD